MVVNIKVWLSRIIDKIDYISDWSVTTVCNTDRDCSGPGFVGQCSRVDGGTYDKSGTRYFGWCTPSDCNIDSGCPDVGDICTEGMISGKCNANGKCEYESFQLVAMCHPPALPQLPIGSLPN